MQVCSWSVWSQATHSVALGCSACSSFWRFLLCNSISALRFFASSTVSSLLCRSSMPVDTNPCLRLSLCCVNSLIRSLSERCHLPLHVQYVWDAEVPAAAACLPKYIWSVLKLWPDFLCCDATDRDVTCEAGVEGQAGPACSTV